MKKLLITLLLSAPFAVQAAPITSSVPTLLPLSDSLYDLGTSTKTFRDLFVDQICLSADCKTAWPTSSDPFSHFNGGNSATTSSMAIGTTTANNYQLTVSSSTAPQLSLSASTGLLQWAFRNAGGNLYISTTTVDGTATTSTSAFSIIGSSGNVGIGVDSPSNSLSFSSGANRTIGIERSLSGAGSPLIFRTAGAPVGATNTAAGSLYLSTGTSTGIGGSNAGTGIFLQVSATSSLSGTTDIEPITKLAILNQQFQFGCGVAGGGTDLPSGVGGTFTICGHVIAPGGSTANLMRLISPPSLTRPILNAQLFDGTSVARINNNGLIESEAGLSTFVGGIGFYQNLLLRSEELNISPWTKSGPVGRITVTDNATTSPDGSVNASEINTNASWTSSSILTQTYSTTTTSIYTFSVWLKATTTRTVTIGVTRDSGAAGVSSSVTITPTWARYQITSSSLTPSSNIRVNINPTKINDQFWAWGAQLTSANSPQIYAKTSTQIVDLNKSLYSNYTVFAPSISVKGMPGSADNLLNVASSSGTAYLTVQPAGSVGIGTTTPWGKLSINNSTADTAGQPLFVVASSTASATTTSFLVGANGNVGIGTTSPTSVLSVNGNTYLNGYLGVGTSRPDIVNGISLPATRSIFQLNNGTDVSQFIVAGRGTSSVPGGVFEFLDYNGPTNAKWLSLQNKNGFTEFKSVTDNGNTGTTILSLDLANKYAGVGTSTPTNKLTIADSAASQLTLSDTTGIAQWAFRNAGGNFYLSTTTVAGTATTSTSALTINGSSGNVGIGTTNPGAKLEVVGNMLFNGGAGAVANNIYVGSSASGKVNASFGFQTAGVGSVDASDGPYFIARGNLFSAIANQRGNVYLLAGNPTTPGASEVSINFYTGNEVNRLMITKDGNVGIGTSTPSQKLDINGGMKLDTSTAQPTCDASVRGTFWFVRNGAGVKDQVEVCAKDAGDAYAWRVIY